jgi:hypothetical protein
MANQALYGQDTAGVFIGAELADHMAGGRNHRMLGCKLGATPSAAFNQQCGHGGAEEGLAGQLTAEQEGRGRKGRNIMFTSYYP